MNSIGNFFQKKKKKEKLFNFRLKVFRENRYYSLYKYFREFNLMYYNTRSKIFLNYFTLEKMYKPTFQPRSFMYRFNDIFSFFPSMWSHSRRSNSFRLISSNFSLHDKQKIEITTRITTRTLSLLL